MNSVDLAIARADLICFDNDGTLFASHEVANPAIQRSFVRFCAAEGLDLAPPTDEEICRLTGQPGPVFYRDVLPEPLRHRSEEFRSLCLDEEVRDVLERGRLFGGMEELLRRLRAAGRKTALVSNGGERYIGAVIRRVGYDSLLDAIYHFGKQGHLRKSEMIRSALEDLGATSAVMVGDRASDLEGAREAGVPFVGCLFGYGAPGEIEGADRRVGSVQELTDLLFPATG